jgi:hypothetical protein
LGQRSERGGGSRLARRLLRKPSIDVLFRQRSVDEREQDGEALRRKNVRERRPIGPFRCML